jgi:hypothetical protein
VKAGELPKCKYSVRIERYSGGQSLNVSIKEYQGPIHDRRHMELDHELRKGAKTIGKDRYRDLYAERAAITTRFTQEVVDLIKALEGMVDQWNYDGSETQVDYFNVNYYSHVSVDSDQVHAEWVLMMDEIKAGGRDKSGLRIFDPERVA